MSTAVPGANGDVHVDVPVESGSEEIVLVAEGDVGVGQLAGFIELPPGGDESSAGWSLRDADDGTVFMLGQLSTDGCAEEPRVAADIDVRT